MMYLRAITTGIVGFIASFSVLLADEKAPSGAECPFSYVLPSDIRPVKYLYSKETQDDPVVWSVDCSPIPSLNEYGSSLKRAHLTYLTCFIEPTRPHRRICPTTKRWNGLDKIGIFTVPADPPSTIVEYVASSSDGYILSIRADVKSKVHDALMKQTLSAVVKIAASVRRKSNSPPTPGQLSPATSAKDISTPVMVTFKAITGCPFEFKLPKAFTPRMESIPKGAHGGGEIKSGRWFILCSSDPETNVLYRSTLEGLSCRIETTPPHHQICARSKRWNGSDRLTLETVEGQSKIVLQAFTAQDQLLLFAITPEKHASPAVIEKAIGFAQAVSRSVNPAK
ncbi:MAG: hypothetical protein ABJM26_10365 [Anderseniella sp.]